MLAHDLALDEHTAAPPEATTEALNDPPHHAVGRTAVRIGAARLVVVGRVRFDRVDGRTRAVWNRGLARGHTPRLVGALLSPAGDTPTRIAQRP